MKSEEEEIQALTATYGGLRLIIEDFVGVNFHSNIMIFVESTY